MNRRAFTLVEIIISIGLIAIIGTIFAVGINSKNNVSNNLEDVTKVILDAAHVYFSTETDDNGDSYAEGIYNGGAGLIIPVTDLVNKGYIDEATFEKLNDLDDDEKIVLVSFKSAEECETGTTITAGWVDKTAYICDFKKEDSKVLSIYNTLKNNRYCLTYGTDDEEGLCNIDANNFYYTGDISNNYIKFDGTDELFRVVKTVDATLDGSSSYIKLTTNTRVTKADVTGESYYKKQFRFYNNNGYIYYTPYTDWSKRFWQEITMESNGSLTAIPYTDTDDESKCQYDTQTFSSWSDSTSKLWENPDCKYDAEYSYSSQSYYYVALYEPLKNWFDELNSVIQDNAIEYEWCTKKDDCDNYKIKSKFATLYRSDYSYIMRNIVRNSSSCVNTADFWDKQLTSSTTEGCAISEVVFDSLVDGLSYAVTTGAYSVTSGTLKSYIWLRPSIMIDGNLKVIGGTGTEDDPYVIKV